MRGHAWSEPLAPRAWLAEIESTELEEAESDLEETAAQAENEDYEEGTDAIDEERWDEAVQHFDAVVAKKGRKADGARYWKAYAQSKAGRSAEALATLGELRRAAPQSRWLDDARALELQIRQRSGERPSPDRQGDDELKLLALNGLAHQEPEKAIPMLETVLGGASSVKMKQKALFVLAQIGSPQAREILARVARGEKHPQLQMEAIKYLGLFGGPESRQTLADVYAASTDADVKKAVLHGFMTSGDKARVLALARGEKDPELRKAAIHQLGIMGRPGRAVGASTRRRRPRRSRRRRCTRSSSPGAWSACRKPFAPRKTRSCGGRPSTAWA